MDYISLKDCKPERVYRVDARNFGIGVFDPTQKGFIGIRCKFDDKYLDTELHWDAGAPHGTVKPIEELGRLPIHIVLSELIEGKTNHLLFEFIEALDQVEWAIEWIEPALMQFCEECVASDEKAKEIIDKAWDIMLKRARRI